MRVPYFQPWISPEDKKSVVYVLNQRWLTMGQQLKKFEKKFSSYVKTNFAIGVGSATHALHLSLRALNVNRGDEIIVPTFTFAATAHAVMYCGAKPILTDIDSEIFNISPKDIRRNITKRTKGIVAVHYGGQSCDMQEILEIAKEKDLFVVEDCAHALGAEYHGRRCGSIGITGCFSFYPTKIITTGEGGMVTTNNPKISKKINILRSQGINITANKRELIGQWKYDVVDLGYNYRLDEIRASLGLSQIKRVREINKKRIKIAKIYNSRLQKIKGITIPKVKSGRNHIYHLYTIKINKDYHMTRDELFKHLHNKQIGSSVQYYPLHLMSLYKSEKNDHQKLFKNANLLKDKLLSLPIFPTMTNKQIEYVIANLNN